MEDFCEGLNHNPLRGSLQIDKIGFNMVHKSTFLLRICNEVEMRVGNIFNHLAETSLLFDSLRALKSPFSPPENESEGTRRGKWQEGKGLLNKAFSSFIKGKEM